MTTAATDIARGESDSLHVSMLVQTASTDFALAAVRDLLGMQIAHATEHRGDTQHFRVVAGDTADFGLPGARELALAETYCVRALDAASQTRTTMCRDQICDFHANTGTSSAGNVRDAGFEWADVGRSCMALDPSCRSQMQHLFALAVAVRTRIPSR